MSRLAELNDAAKTRLWERILHEDNLLNDRFNIFIVFESAWFGVVGVLYTTGASNVDLIHLISILGLFLTIVWILALFKQRHIVNVLQSELLEAGFEEYDISAKREVLKIFGLNIDSDVLLIVIIPLVIAFVWLMPIFLT